MECISVVHNTQSVVAMQEQEEVVIGLAEEEAQLSGLDRRAGVGDHDEGGQLAGESEGHRIRVCELTVKGLIVFEVEVDGHAVSPPQALDVNIPAYVVDLRALKTLAWRIAGVKALGWTMAGPKTVEQ